MPIALRRPFVLVLFAAFLAGCGGAQASSATATEGEGGGWAADDWGDDAWGDETATTSEGEAQVSAIDAMGITGPETPWAQMSTYDREMYMVGKVLPIMQDLFARQDPERFSHYDCDTCHGEEMREVEFHMPPASAFSVPAEGTPAWTGMERTSPDMVRFMKEQVTPTMGTLLGIEGFTCTGCHPSR